MSLRFGKHPPIQSYRNLNLLAHAQIAEFDVGSRCGGYGECGGDRIRVTRGKEFLSPVTSAEREHLSEEELRTGFRLACQCFPNDESAEIEVEI